MLVAPAVDWEISAPPTTPRGTSRSSPLALTTLMRRSLRVEPVVDGLRAGVVLRRLPRQPRGAPLPAGRPAALDQRVGRAGAAGLRGDEQVVHEPDAPRAERRPQPEDGGEADRAAVVAAREE